MGYPLDIKLPKGAEKRRLAEVGLKFTRTQLGAAVFVPMDNKLRANNMIFPADWTIAQLRAMANYMEAYPNCTIFSDGSGSPCK